MCFPIKLPVHIFTMFQLTWVDIGLADILRLMSDKWEGILNEWKLLCDLMMRVNNLPRIKAWLESRPKTDN